VPPDGSPVAIVTGGGRGIGFACVQRLLAGGFAVCVVEVNPRAIATATDTLAAAAGRLHFAAASVTDRPAMHAVVAELVARWGRLDVLVNNAGVNRAGGIFSQTDEDWDAVLETNLKGAFVASAAAAAAMRSAHYGAIVNIGSIAAAGFGASPAYAASKAGLIGLTRQMARELGPEGITVNVVAPGVTTTDWVARHLDDAAIAATEAATPMRRAGTPADIAGIVAFLASADARHITGQVISASGGYWMP